MRIQLTFWRLADKRPKPETTIIYVSDGLSPSELRSGEVYYLWNEEDGGSYENEPGGETSTQLAVCVDGFELSPSSLWADLDAFNLKIDAANKVYVCPHLYREICGESYCSHCGEKAAV